MKKYRQIIPGCPNVPLNPVHVLRSVINRDDIFSIFYTFGMFEMSWIREGEKNIHILICLFSP